LLELDVDTESLWSDDLDAEVFITNLTHPDLAGSLKISSSSEVLNMKHLEQLKNTSSSAAQPNLIDEIMGKAGKLVSGVSELKQALKS